VKDVERFGSGEELGMVYIAQLAFAACRSFQQRKEGIREDDRTAARGFLPALQVIDIPGVCVERRSCHSEVCMGFWE
jgi:hypothetical protein